ncbi:TPA: hypothetical protein N0F65_002321 [Lagenidium giganteum]|uniref:C2 domain-containing protein n=1 Tax=Lagenidium giganteum TaxID=4803 RepID=A0AAV2Z4H4_9STRA|nr:TPA: hypothetical protein N0F65_002321 [Lagenidium giganteum]
MGLERVGQRVDVYWPSEAEWFHGTIQAFNDDEGYFVLYDDGDEQWESASTAQIRFVEDNHANEDEDADDGTAFSTADEPMAHLQVAPVGKRPEMMEPPPTTLSDDDGGYSEPEGDHADDLDAPAATRLVPAIEDANDSDNDNDEDKPDGGDTVADDRDVLTPTAQAHNVKGDADEDGADGSDQGDEGETNLGDDGAINTMADDDDDSHSVVPQLFDKLAVGNKPTSKQASDIPASGVLRGKVLRASNLISTSANNEPPRTCVKISFVAPGRDPSENLMLRCKSQIGATAVCHSSTDPVWNQSIDDVDDALGGSDTNGAFRLHVAPPIVAPRRDPSWDQLRGDFLFTVYSVSTDGVNSNNHNGRRTPPEFVGQALVPMRLVIKDALVTPGAFCLHTLALESRQGKLLPNDPELVVAFQLVPQYTPPPKKTAASATKKPLSAQSADAKSAGTLDSARRSTTSTRKKNAGAPQSKHGVIGLHPSSSGINRRRFAKQVQAENVAYMRRLEDKQVRRDRMAQAKSGDSKGHKASSAINRSKFHEQVSQDNKAMGRRLQSILQADAKQQAKAMAKKATKDCFDAEERVRDKAYATDKREMRFREQDYLMEKAQAKYAKQNELVDEVMDLQMSVAELKAQLITLTNSTKRLELLNKKDQHVRDCLVRAVKKMGTVGSVQSPSPTRRKPANKTSNQAGLDDTEGAGSAEARVAKKQLELLSHESTTLQDEKKLLGREFKELTDQEEQVIAEIAKVREQLDFVQRKRAFHMQVRNTKDGLREWKRRRQRMELNRDEEEQLMLLEAQDELQQLQVTVQSLQDKITHGETTQKRQTGSLAAACEYLERKVSKYRAKAQALERDKIAWQSKYEELAVSGQHEELRKQVHELQHMLFLCQHEAKHVKMAERHGNLAKTRVDVEFQRKLFQEQTETDILLKKPANASPST